MRFCGAPDLWSRLRVFRQPLVLLARLGAMAGTLEHIRIIKSHIVRIWPTGECGLELRAGWLELPTGHQESARRRVRIAVVRTKRQGALNLQRGFIEAPGRDESPREAHVKPGIVGRDLDGRPQRCDRRF